MSVSGLVNKEGVVMEQEYIYDVKPDGAGGITIEITGPSSFDHTFALAGDAALVLKDAIANALS